MFLDHLPHSLKSGNRWVFQNSEVRSPGICFLPYVSTSWLQVSSYFHNTFFPIFPSKHFILSMYLLPPVFFLPSLSLGPPNFCSIKIAVIPTILSTNNYKYHSIFSLAETGIVRKELYQIHQNIISF